MNFKKIQYLLTQIAPTVIEIINSFLYFILTVIRGVIKIAMKQVRG